MGLLARSTRWLVNLYSSSDNVNYQSIDGRNRQVKDGEEFLCPTDEAQRLLDNRTDVRIASPIALFTAEAVTASTGTAASENVQGKAFSELVISGTVTVAGASGNVALTVRTSDDGATWTTEPFFDCTSGAYSTVAVKNFTADGAFVFVVRSLSEYVDLYVDNNRDAEATITAVARCIYGMG